MKQLRVLRYASDLHLELRQTIKHPKLFPLWDFQKDDKTVYYLALLGDIGNPFQDNLRIFLKKIHKKYEKIFYVPGNHEYYNLSGSYKSKDKFHERLQEICEEFENVLLLDNKTFTLDGLKIIGSTLWSNIPDDKAEYIKLRLNDYHLIKKTIDSQDIPINITVSDTNKWNEESISFIKNEIENSSDPCVILTHHAPLFSDPEADIYTADPIYLNGGNNYAFHNDLSSMMNKPICAWLYGHTHYASSFKYNDVLVCTNQLGYSNEEKDIKFNPYAYLDIDKLIIDNL